MGLPPQAARIAGSWTHTPAAPPRPARATREPQSRSTRRHASTRLTHPFARPA
ncbi:hypothetical protein [Intrasporangium sp. YIM S08009]|uniref:hypothetical protein n=1 Tax=Intrasporangium zincisolvens TaxID=3080018 RepID=UPI002B05678B|nr:hypothetical protein [Intrasporangium sp. YIM S08009]